MNNLEIFVLLQWVSLVGIAIGLGASWGALKTEVKNLKDTLSDKHSGLGAIKKSVDDYGREIGSMDERVKALERERNKS